jgi:hypothetical protein
MIPTFNGFPHTRKWPPAAGFLFLTRGAGFSYNLNIKSERMG